MRLPKGASYKFISTKATSIDALLEKLGSENFSGYVRITVEKEGKINDGFLLLKEGVVIGAEFQGTDTHFSKNAYKKIEDVWKLEGIVDMYSYTEFQIQFAIEENPEALIAPSEKKPSKKVETVPKVDEIKTSKERIAPSKPPETPPATTEKTTVKAPEIEVPITPSEAMKSSDKDESAVAEDVLEKSNERLKLLKKLGLKEPKNDFVDSILKSVRLPSERELNTKSREIKKGIIKRLNKNTKLEELDVYISPSKLKDIIEFEIAVYAKPLNKKIEKEIKTTIEDTLKEKLSFAYKKRLIINAV